MKAETTSLDGKSIQFYVARFGGGITGCGHLKVSREGRKEVVDIVFFEGDEVRPAMTTPIRLTEDEIDRIEVCKDSTRPVLMLSEPFGTHFFFR